MKMPSSIPKTAALKTSAVTKVAVDAVVAWERLFEDLAQRTRRQLLRIRAKSKGEEDRTTLT